MPEEIFSKLREITKKEWKIAFISAVIIGFLTHMFVFTHMLPNHDALINIYSPQNKMTSGRFFLGPFSGLSSFFDLPWVIGTLSILYLALTAVLLTEIFKLDKTPSIIVASGLIVTFPTVAATFSYMFTADAYMAGYLLVVLSVLITKKYKWGFFPASFIFYLGVGIYQAYLTVVLTLVTVLFIQGLVVNKLNFRNMVITMGRYITMTAIGLGLYAITFKTYQKYGSVGITNYQGLDQVGTRSENFMDLLTKIKDTFMEFFYRGFVTELPSSNPFEILNILLVVLIVLGLMVFFLENKLYLSPMRIFLALISLFLIPIFIFVLYFVSPGVIYHMLMIMSGVCLYLLLVVLYDGLKIPTFMAKVFSWSTILILFLTIVNFAIISNITYFNMSLRYEKSYAFMNRVLDRVEQTEGYENVTKIAVIGRPDLETRMSSRLIPEKIPFMTGAMGESFLAESYHYVAMLQNYFGESIRGVSGEELQSIKESDFFKEMQPWPSKDAVRVKGEIVIVKLG